jgi:serine/threonine-protein kinase RsbW
VAQTGNRWRGSRRSGATIAVNGHDVIETSPTVRLQLDSRPESVTVVRSMLAGIGEALAFDAELLDDLKTAVSEACNNVVLHAYDGNTGPLVVTLQIGPDAVEATVRDRGGGIRHVSASSDERMGVGLAVISALADRAEFLSAPDGGTEVRMSFRGRGAGVQVLDPKLPRAAELPPAWLIGDVVGTLSPAALLPAVLGRVARALAASARFSLDRFSDVYLVTDAVAAFATEAAAASELRFAITAAPRCLELTIGPFRAGTGEGAGRAGAPLTRLVDDLSVLADGPTESLRLVMVDHRPPAADG